MTREQKLSLRLFLKNYPDERLAALLAHAQDGKLSYHSCCCFVGALTSQHRLRGIAGTDGAKGWHLAVARTFIGAGQAERTFSDIGLIETMVRPARRWGLIPATTQLRDSDAERRRLVIPIIRAEMKRRAAARQEATNAAEASADAVQPEEPRRKEEELVYV